MTAIPPSAQTLQRLVAVRAGFRTYLSARTGADLEEFLPVLIAAVQDSPAFSDDTRLADWLVETIRDAAIAHAVQLPPALRARAWPAAYAPAGPADERAAHHCLEALVDTLKPQDAALLHLVEFAGTSVWTAATALGIPVNTAWGLLHRARVQTRVKFEALCRDCLADASSRHPFARSA